MKRICLCMIVKNEAHVIERALSSVRPYISCWVVCDTGSTDGTQSLVEHALAGIPGHLYEDQWVDFAHNRSRAVERAHTFEPDYLLTLDADEVLCVQDQRCFDDLSAPVYGLRTLLPPYSYLQDRLLRADLPWRYSGALHERPVCGQEYPLPVLQGLYLTTAQDGARSREPGKLQRDIDLMQAALAQSPDDGRLWFHLGFTYKAHGEPDKAIDAFGRRIAITDGFAEERWYARYMLGRLYIETDRWWLVEDTLLAVYADYPASAESLFWLGRFWMGRGAPERALPYFELATRKRQPPGLFIAEADVYEWEARLHLARCLVQLGRAGDANAVLVELTRDGKLPPDVLEPETAAQIAQWALEGAVG